jgi:hypothetical protein
VGPTYQCPSAAVAVTIRGAGASWVGPAFWPRPVGLPAAPFFLFKLFSFYVFETKGFVLQQNFA